MYKKGLVAILSVALVCSITGCGGNNNNTSTPTTPAAPAATDQAAGTVHAEAEATYKKTCLGCHAADLSGNSGPNLQKVGGDMTVNEIADKIAGGGAGMPAFKDRLTADEINALAEWLSTKT